MKNKYIAPMWDRMQFFCKQITDHQIRLILHFNEILNKELLKDAIEVTLVQNPIAYAKYNECKNEAFWNYSNMDIDKIYSFRECTTTEQILNPTIVNQLNTLTGPQLSITLIHSITDTLVLNCNHTITDAVGVKGFIYQLAENYTQLPMCLFKYSQTQDNPPSRSFKLISKQLEIKDKVSILQIMMSSKRRAPTFNMSINVNSLENPNFKTHTFSIIEFKALKKFGKLHGATVNDMLIAIYFFTLKRLLSNSNKTNRLTYSSDFRSYINNKECDILSNFSGFHNIDLDNTTDSFEDILNDISTQTKLRKQRCYNLGDLPMMAILLKTLPYQKCKKIFYKEFAKIKDGKSNAAPSICNVGIIDAQRIRFGTMSPSKAFVLGGINHPGQLQLVASTYKSQLTISFGSYFNGRNEAFISTLIDEFRKIYESKMLSVVCENN